MKRVFINLLVLFASLILALVAAEVTARVYLSYQDKVLRQKRQGNILTQVNKRELFAPVNPGSFTNQANATVHWWGFDLTTDSLGCREGIPADDSARVILFLGDSMVFGLGLGDSLTIPSLLQRQLEPGAKVVNAAVIGYDFRQYLQRLKRLVPALKPDVVLVGICYNDLFPNEDPFGTVMAERGYEDERPRLRYGDDPVRRPSIASQVKKALQSTGLYLLFQKSDLREKLRKPVPPSYTEPAVIDSKQQAPELVAELLATLEEMHIPAGFVYFPTPDKLHQESHFAYVRLLQQEGQPLLDLGLSERLTEESYFLRQKGQYIQPDIHFNLAGSRVVAAEIAVWMKGVGLWK